MVNMGMFGGSGYTCDSCNMTLAPAFFLTRMNIQGLPEQFLNVTVCATIYNLCY